MRRNIKKILDLVQEIDETRTDIGMRYGSFDEEAQAFKIDDGNLSIADDELKSLMSIKQEFEIDVISLEDFGNIEMTPSQIDAIMFMIEAE